jgi:hypothetical protein
LSGAFKIRNLDLVPPQKTKKELDQSAPSLRSHSPCELGQGFQKRSLVLKCWLYTQEKEVDAKNINR